MISGKGEKKSQLPLAKVKVRGRGME